MFRPTGRRYREGRWYREDRLFRGRGRYRRYRRRRGAGGLLRRILAALLIGRIIRIILRRDRPRNYYD